MPIKIRKKNGLKETIRYKGAKKILTPYDIKLADRLDRALNNEIQKIEKILLKEEMLTPKARKSDMLKAWHLIGSSINQFLEKHRIFPGEEKIFWDHLYGRSALINKTIPTGRISNTRNDFKIASILARYPLNKLQKIGLWALWREILTYKAFKDERVLMWVIGRLEKFPPKTRNEARPFLKAVAARLKKIDTTVLTNRELQRKLERIKT